MLMEAIQGQMQLYHSVAGPLHIPNLSQQPPPTTTTAGGGGDGTPATTPGAPTSTSTDAQASELGDEDSSSSQQPYKVTVDGKEMVFGSKEECKNQR
eukprot:sb/3479074/